MRRFDYDENEEYRNEVDNFFGENEQEMSNDYLSPEEYDEILKEEQENLELQKNIVKQEFNHRILRFAIKMSENSFWWRFYSISTRLKIIDRTYKRLKKLEEVLDGDL